MSCDGEQLFGETALLGEVTAYIQCELRTFQNETSNEVLPPPSQPLSVAQPWNRTGQSVDNCGWGLPGQSTGRWAQPPLGETLREPGRGSTFLWMNDTMAKCILPETQHQVAQYQFTSATPPSNPCEPLRGGLYPEHRGPRLSMWMRRAQAPMIFSGLELWYFLNVACQSPHIKWLIYNLF